ncbi:MAG TPA: dTMP kinase [Candidatus Limnocylindrales bacterium]
MTDRDRRGWFVTIEGPEGSGKTTHARAVAEAGAGLGLEVVLTREPGGTPLGEAIRTILLDPEGAAGIDPRADALLFNAARAQLVEDVIRPALDRGALVVCARYADSTAAYQGHGRGLDVAELRALERFATRDLRPDLTILLDLPVAEGLARKAPDDETRFEGLDLAFHERVRAGFRALAREEPGRFAVVDASRARQQVEADALAVVRRLPGLEDIAARSLVIPNRPTPA